MALVVTDAGEILQLQVLIDSQFDLGEMHLYQNDVTPDGDTILADLTEATFPGYASIAFTAWGAAFTNANDKAQTDHGVLTWTMSGGSPTNNIFGYYVLDSVGNLVWVERDPSAPFPMDADGKQYQVLPRFTLFSEFGN